MVRKTTRKLTEAMNLLANRLKKIKPSATMAVDAKAKEMEKKGINVINLSVGEPTFPVFGGIRNAGIQAIKQDFSKYTPVEGIKELREAITKKLKRDNGLDYKNGEVIVSSGAKHSIFNLFLALLNPGDEVIVFLPYWVSYPEMVRLAGGKPVFVKTNEIFHLIPGEIKKAISKKTKMIIVNSPNNPSGWVATKKELRLIADLAVKHNLWVLSDEIYEKFLYEGAKHISIASLNKKIKEQTITINGISKTYGMTGWRIGYTAGPKEIINGIKKIQSQTTSNACSIAQKAALEALKKEYDGEIKKVVNYVNGNRNEAIKILNEIPGFRTVKPEGAFYFFIDIQDISKNSLNFAQELLEEAKVAVIPGIAFGMEGFIRISYALDQKSLLKGVKQIKDFVISSSL